VEILLISAVYYFMPTGRLSAQQHALIVGATAGLLWEFIRMGCAGISARCHMVSVVYGSLATGIIVLLSLEVAATLLLFGAQVIAEYERIETGEARSRGGRCSLKASERASEKAQSMSGLAA